MNPYLKKLREQYEGLRRGIDGVQTRAVEAGVDLTPEELTMITNQSEQARGLFAQIEQLTEIETRDAKVKQLSAQITQATTDQSTGNAAGGGETIPVGGASATDRDPGHYTRNSKHSFFRDLTRSRAYGDTEAARRLVEHNRALNTVDEGPGVVAPKWLVEEFAELARQGRSVANVVRNIPLGDDPRPLTLPKQTAGSDSEVVEQAAENDPIEDDDAWDSAVDTVTPKPTAGSQIVSRQMLDMSSPAIDQLIYADLIGAYNDKIERKVSLAILAVGTALPAIEGEDPTAAGHYSKIALKAAVEVRKARKRPANILVMSVGRHGEFLGLHDTTGRPLIPDTDGSPTNVVGIGSVQTDGRFRSLAMIATEGFTDDQIFAAVRSTDVLLFESNMMRFRYEQPLGPESIKLGIWAYTAVQVRYGTAAVKKVEVDEGS